MEKIKIAVKNNSACLLAPVKLVAGTVAQECEFFFDETWAQYKDKLIKIKRGDDIYGPYALYGTVFIIPASIMEEPGDPLEIGLIGNSKVPTSWCHVGRVLSGADDEPSNILPDEDDGIHIIYDGGVIE